MAAEGIFQVAGECRLPKPLQPLNPKYQIPKKPPPHWESAQICKWTYSTYLQLKPKFTSKQGQPLSLKNPADHNKQGRLRMFVRSKG